MAKNYTTVQGDTFETISRKVYGTENEARRIRKANPAVVEPFVEGVLVVVPKLPNDPENRAQTIPSDNVDEVALTIENERFRFWDSMNITRTLDSVSTIEFSAPFEPDQAAFRERFRPFSYKDAKITVDGTRLFSGTMVAVRPQSQENSRSVSVSCYSVPGVLGDCTLPGSALPAEYDNLTLREIAQNVLEPFGIGLIFEGADGDRFERVAIAAEERVWVFLSDLVRQRKKVMSSTDDGRVLITDVVQTGQPVLVARQGEAGPIVSVTPAFTEQDYYSDVTGIEPVVVGTEGSIHTVKNARLTGTVRPFTFLAKDSDGGSLPEAVEAKAARMFANMVSYQVTLATWRDASGNLLQPNTTLKLEWPDAMIYSLYEFVIRDVVLSATDEARTATLTVVLPGAFTGEVPEVLPWDG